ncbi:MAG: hypothetical protein GYA55_04400 [SAR324 cluster bacterium]|uniref:Uncharacterized protein n=1 Tax=SAR324 cluster bacterium TaxID=2024889 RepID=A0A7X9FR89_9DELT|nr:hypothetical protein [SAR324 cluster bacterium]
MPFYQIVEKDDFGTDWAPVRYHDAATRRFATEEDALKVAKEYITDLNVNNALAVSEKEESAEAWMMLPEGVFLGVLDKKDWFMRYQKDVIDPKTKQLVAHKGDVVKDSKYYKLQGKTCVAVRTLPGT